MIKKYFSPVFSSTSFIFIIPVLIFIIFYIVFGYYFETNDDYIISLMLSGRLLPDNGGLDIYYIHKLLLLFYSYLFSISDSINWYGTFLCVFNLIAVINTFIIIQKIFSRHISQIHLVIFSLLLIILIFFENIISVSFYKTAIILGGSSLLLIFYQAGQFRSNERSYKVLVLSSLFFILGFFSRPPAVALAALIILPFAVFVFYKLKKLKAGSYAISVFIVFALLLQFSYSFLKTPEQHEREDFTSSWLNATEYQSANPVDLYGPADSIRKEALKYFFVSDRKLLNDEFMNKISSPDVFSAGKIRVSRIKSAAVSIVFLTVYEYPAITALNILIILFIAINFFKNSKRDFFWYLAIQILFILLIAVIHIFMKLPTRLFSPLFLIYTLCNIMLLRFIDISLLMKKFIIISSALLIILSFISLYSFYNRFNFYYERSNENFRILSYLESNFNSTTILITQPSYTILDGNDPLKIISTGSNKIMPVAGWPVIMPSYYRELKSKFNSSDLNDLFSYISDHPEDFIILSNEKFNEFLQLYFRILYGSEYEFDLLPDTPEVLKNRNMKLYIIKKQPG